MVNMTWASCYEKAHVDSRQHFPLAFWKSDYHNIFIRLSVTDILFLWLSHFSLCFWSRSVLLFNYCQWRLFNLLRLKLNHYSIFKNAFNFLLRAHLKSESFLYVQYFLIDVLERKKVAWTYMSQCKVKEHGRSSQVQDANPLPFLHHTSLWQAISLLDSESRLRDHLKHSGLVTAWWERHSQATEHHVWTLASWQSRICSAKKIMTNDCFFFKIPFPNFTQKIWKFSSRGRFTASALGDL